MARATKNPPSRSSASRPSKSAKPAKKSAAARTPSRSSKAATRKAVAVKKPAAGAKSAPKKAAKPAPPKKQAAAKSAAKRPARSPASPKTPKKAAPTAKRSTASKKPAAQAKKAAQRKGTSPGTGARRRETPAPPPTGRAAPGTPTDTAKAAQAAARQATAPGGLERAPSTQRRSAARGEKSGPSRTKEPEATVETARKPKKPELTPKEIAQIRTQLEEQRTNFLREYNELEEGAFTISQSEMSGEVSFDEEYADAGSFTFEREKELSIGQNIRDLLDRVNLALSAIDNGTYGLCENCGEPINKARLLALPSSTLCIDCKQIEERSR